MESKNYKCTHVSNLEGEILKAYHALYKIFVISATKIDRMMKQKHKKCHECRSMGSYLHACLHCIYFGCVTHIRDHGKGQSHMFSIELSFGQVHCMKCGDYIYTPILDSVSMDTKLGAKACRKRLFSWTYFESPGESADLMNYKAKRICITPESTIGLRGLLNLGNTCFMNCIIQSFMHMPLLREYFLTERHKCSRPPSNCLVCELSKLFQDFYKGLTTPLSLHKLLHLIWTHAKHLAGYEQQDAHEFFIAMLEVLQEHGNGNSQEDAKKNSSKRSTSIIDQIFTGRLQSDVVCKKCKGVSTRIEPMKDVGLDLGPISGGRPPLDIQECLERYTRAEDLGEHIMCSSCNSHQESTKQLTMKTLPIVASFQLKRFQHIEEIEKKISTKISFPESLDMTPYMSISKDTSPNTLRSDNKYSLFAVINHEGNLINGGHYTAYIRQQRDYWYKCNDHVITRANIQDVLESQAYLLFYHKNILLYD